MKPLAKNEHTLKDSFEFTHQILGLDNVPFMCSFDIVSLFTCIPVKETIELCLDLLYKDTELVHNLTRSQFKKLLVYCVQENQFCFEDKYHDQVGGVAMGSPLGPILANIFMFQFESKTLSKYNGNHPLFYKRYCYGSLFVTD